MKLGFLYPEFNIGGAQLLLARLAQFVATNNLEIELYYIDYVDGYSANWLKKRNVKFTHIIFDKDVDTLLPVNLTIVMPFDLNSIKACANNLVLNKTKFIFWFIEPNLLLAIFHSTKIHWFASLAFIKGLVKILFHQRYKKIQKLLYNSHQNGSVLFMDGENLQIPQFFFPFLKQNSKILPIPIIINKTDTKKYSEKLSELHCAWLGRVSLGKLNSILAVLNDLEKNAQSFSKSIIFHIIGDGEAMQQLLLAVRNTTTITIIQHGVIDGKELDCLLKTKVDLLFAMGTSALEGGALSIPTVLLDPLSNKHISKYKYKWLFETENFTLGQIKQNHLNKYSMYDILEKATDINTWKEVAHSSYVYAKQHDIINIGSNFLDICLKCNNEIEQNAFPN